MVPSDSDWDLSADDEKFAGPCAQGVLDPVISLVPGLFLFYCSILEHPWGDWIQKRDPWWPSGGSQVASRWILVVGHVFVFMLLAWARSTFSNLNGPTPPTCANLGQLAANLVQPGANLGELGANFG